MQINFSVESKDVAHIVSTGPRHSLSSTQRQLYASRFKASSYFSLQSLSTEMENLVREAISYAVTHGIVVAEKQNALVGTALSHAPITVFPSPVDRACFDKARKLVRPLNEMISHIAADRKYLQETLAETADADAEFTGRLLDLMIQVPHQENSIGLSILRHDFFVHKEAENAPSLRMVEMNCISASFACLGTLTGQMHRYLVSNPAAGDTQLSQNSMPENDAISSVTHGIATAHNTFVEQFKVQSEISIQAIMVVLPGERNIFDQELLRSNLWTKHAVPMTRMTLTEINRYASLNDDRLLVVSQPNVPRFVCSVAYFRAGYSPSHYPSEAEWSARKIIECSTAAKCPTVAVQLVGSKKIQQVLDQAGEVERFIDNPEDAALIRSSFARQYSLSPGVDGDRAAKMALDDPDKFVLKPQREGGGNNLYDQELKHALENMSVRERSSHVLMERIKPVIVTNTLMRDGKWETGDVVSELGVYGIYVSYNGASILNDDGGILLRSKLASQNDGGVAAGVAVLDSPLLS